MCEIGEQEVIPVAAPFSAREQLARYIQKYGLPGDTQPFDDEMLQYREIVVVVGSEDQLQAWVAATRPFQIDVLQGVHEHGSAPGIADHIRYVVIRANGADGAIGGGAEGEFSPAASGWSLWVRFYPDGRTIFQKPPADKDLFPGRENNLLLPLRKGLQPETGSTLPHQQLTQLAPVALRTSMRIWMDTHFAHVRTGPSYVSDHVTWAMHLDGISLAPHARILTPFPGAAEFAHMHVDGSWHLSLPAEDRWEVMIKGWGAVHPVAAYGINAIMFFAPRDEHEMRHVQDAVTTAYRYAVGELR
jgi:phospholipase/carboxylesterase